jgi:hypothetical protein
MTTAEIIQIVKDVGVPVAMLVWFALRVEKKLDEIDKHQVDATAKIHEGQLETARQLSRVASALEQVDDLVRERPPTPISTVVPPSLSLAAKGGPP